MKLKEFLQKIENMDLEMSVVLLDVLDDNPETATKKIQDVKVMDGYDNIEETDIKIITIMY